MSCTSVDDDNHTSNEPADDKTICWFCKKGRHSECMKKIPAAEKTDGGPHDCTFDTIMIRCKCEHNKQ